MHRYIHDRRTGLASGIDGWVCFGLVLVSITDVILIKFLFLSDFYIYMHMHIHTSGRFELWAINDDLRIGSWETPLLFFFFQNSPFLRACVIAK